MADTGSILSRPNGPPPMGGIMGGTGLQAWGGKRFIRPMDLSGVRLVAEVVEDSAGKWFEVEFNLPRDLMGDPANGWTGPGAFVALQHSTDLVAWSAAGWATAPAHTPTENADGTVTWRARHATAVFWYDAVIDIHLVSARHGKSITAIEVGGTALSLDFPYAMPSDAAALQADLRAAGFDGALVTSTAGDITATAINYTAFGAPVMYLTVVESEVTLARGRVEGEWTDIDLPGYPYALPSGAADLQADLRDAGFDGAVVRVFGDQWEIQLPDYVTVSTSRLMAVTIDPGDPYKTWDMFANYLGEKPGNVLNSTFDNVRIGGALRAESPRGFARLVS